MGKEVKISGDGFDYSVKGKVKVSMEKYMRGVLDDFPEKIDRTAMTPAGENLFQVREEREREKLPEEQAQAFHRAVTQLLFLTARPRRNICTVVAFLTTRVKDPDMDDWGKLRRVMQYLRRNPGLPLTLQAGDMKFVHWHVDASFGVHPDMKSHTGMTYSMGKGSVIDASKKQKMNTWSTTESELMGVDDAMPPMIWTHLFTQAQGLTPKVVLHQDNRSAVLLEMHGKASSSQRTRHFNICYFYIKDQIKQG